MLPDLVIDSLRRYTAGKAALLSWFTTTAETHEALSITSKPSVEELVTLARRIVQATNPSIRVPDPILRCLTETIDLRKRCNAWYEEQGITDPALRESNRTHRHFFTKLEEILGILRQEPVDEPQILGKQNQDKGNKSNQNLFDAIDIGSLDNMKESDGVDPGQHNTPSQQQPEAAVQSETPQPTLAYEMEDSNGGLHFAVFCLQVDLQKIRQTVSDRLSLFHNGEISLMRVSVVVNAAIGSSRRLEKGFLEAFPSFATWEQVMEATLPHFARIKGPPFLILEPSQMETLGDSLFLPFHQLRRFRDRVHKSNQLPTYPPGAVPFMNRGDHEPAIQDSWKYDAIILNELFGEVASLRPDENVPIQDELVSGLKETLATKCVHLWVVFGLQLFLDTQHLLGKSSVRSSPAMTALKLNPGKSVTRGFRELESTGRVFKNINERHIILAQVALKKKFSEDDKKLFRQNVGLVDKWILRDEMRNACQRRRGKQGRPFFFLLHNPVTCGLFQSALLLKQQKTGMAGANAMQYIPSVAHLYNAAKNESLLNGLWPDMEELISLHGSDGIFLGQPPRDSAQYLSSYLIMRGFSAQTFANRRSNKNVKRSIKGPRLLKSSQLMDSFERLLCQSDPSDSDITVEYIETLLHRIARSRTTQSQKARDLQGQWGTSKSLDSVQLLMLLEECIAAEEPKLTFNYNALNEQCFLILATIELTTKGMFARWVSKSAGPIHNMNRYQHLLPMFIFCRDYNNIILSMAGRTMQDFIQRRCQVPSEKANGVVSDEGWEGLEEEHPTHNGDCLHWGKCDKDTVEMERLDQTPISGSQMEATED
ncbi:MAG: hypothetical protein ALECFALPRED_008148 [Alectoria fallacina]|uniref:DUF6604 domain-containing protein n=1 Tax=Alectoria fallacina TaxID=1903189 RepID=A0A8H3PFH6_9LECA|nr:MAG: hypothetical protein ALECFALPRED_008148 [Alectoria fallacina]